MGLIFVESLPAQELFRCGLCGVDIASADAVMSTDFTGQFGDACLMNRVVNTTTSSQTETKQMLTGTYDVSNIHCSSCQQLLGWRYDRAFSEGQKFKEGKYVLELSRVVKHGW